MKEVIAEMIEILKQEFTARTKCEKQQVNDDCKHKCKSTQIWQCQKAIMLRDKLEELKNKVEG